MATGGWVVALLFPIWFYVQASLSPGPDDNAADLLYATGWLMPLLFVVVPLLGLLFAKINIVETYALRRPPFRFLVAGVLVGISAWVPAHELSALQHSLIEFPKAMLESSAKMAETLVELPLYSVIVLIALVPALSEELLFRGFLLNSLRTATRKWPAICVSALVFAIFHFFIYKFVVTASLGLVLAYLCWQSRSVFPGMLAHLIHNSLGVISVTRPQAFEKIGISSATDIAHLPTAVLIIGCTLFLVAMMLCVRSDRKPSGKHLDALCVAEDIGVIS
jgi:membrane protease YdiL (CAAX protease family)